uniref:CARMIL C-terminal domain-containing protein n=1 Tax=Knipowitschia caucasica TaxID=637954 RepID=A0AAV2LNU6_KNICA
MELPLGGPALRHYTQSRPRPHRQKLNYRPTRLQETIIECENEDFELMGRVDEGVEEFFTKKVLPTETLEKEEDDGEEEEEEMITVHEVAPASTGKPNADTLQMRESVAPRRALREGKSQSLILLSGSASGASRNKKLDGQNSFEQKLHLMLQRIGVSKPQSGETQNQEGEMKKAESEGTIIDNKPEPPTAKPRTMSASSDTRHQLRSSVSAHESAGKPPLLPKPVIKPGPPTTLSGRTTPENELGQIEGKPNGLFSKGAEAAPASQVWRPKHLQIRESKTAQPPSLQKPLLRR